MAVHLKEYRAGFGRGVTMVIRHDEAEDPTGIDFGVVKLEAGEVYRPKVAYETAWLLMSGRVRLQVGAQSAVLERHSLFDETASGLHVAAGETVSMTAEGPVELTIYATPNTRAFASRIFLPKDVPNEHRAKGTLGDACYRFVRTMFDGRNSDPAAELVLGEVIDMPGRWSSYPPHHHPQPEIYHYRFTLPQGYGHAELGETVLKVKQYDTVKIFDGQDHAQCTAPGYGMYYSWVIRHLPGNPYTVPEFTEEHRWTLDPAARFWMPKE
jgi:5-deoxy-glucuronate isomerase